MQIINEKVHIIFCGNLQDNNHHGGVVESADTLDLKSNELARAGSSPAAPTIGVNCNNYPLLKAMLLVQVQYW